MGKSLTIPKPILLAACLTAILCLSGCVEMAPQPTHADLHGAGQQIVDDSVTVWGTFQGIAQSKWESISAKIANEISPNLGYAFAASHVLIEAMGIPTSYQLFFFPPGEYGYDELAGLVGQEDHLHEGTWTVTKLDDGGTWEIAFTRIVDGGMDTVTYTISYSGDSELEYTGSIVYPTTYITEPMVDLHVVYPLTMTAVDCHLGPSTFEGTVDITFTGRLASVEQAVMHGDLDVRFKGNANYVKIAGDLSFNHDPGVEDFISGTLETVDLELMSRIGVTWADNANFNYGYLPAITDALYGHAPSKLVIQGSIADRGTDPTRLEGTMTLEILNADTYDPELPMSADNWLHAKAGFVGLIQAGGTDKFEGELGLEEISYKPRKYKLTGLYKLTNGGVSRQLSASVENTSESVMHIVLDSTWGPAKVVMDATFTPNIPDAEGPPTSVNGYVQVQGARVGTVSLTPLGIVRVDYNDGTFEEF